MTGGEVLAVLDEKKGEKGRTRTLPQYRIQLHLRLMILLRLILLRRRLPLSATAHGRHPLKRLLLPLLIVPPAGCLILATRYRIDVRGALLLRRFPRIVVRGFDPRPDAVRVPLAGSLDVLFCLERLLRLDVEGGGACLRAGARHVEDGDDGDEEEEAVEAHSSLGGHGGRAKGQQRVCCGGKRGGVRMGGAFVLSDVDDGVQE